MAGVALLFWLLHLIKAFGITDFFNTSNLHLRTLIWSLFRVLKCDMFWIYCKKKTQKPKEKKKQSGKMINNQLTAIRTFISWIYINTSRKFPSIDCSWLSVLKHQYRKQSLMKISFPSSFVISENERKSNLVLDFEKFNFFQEFFFSVWLFSFYYI